MLFPAKAREREMPSKPTSELRTDFTDLIGYTESDIVQLFAFNGLTQ